MADKINLIPPNELPATEAENIDTLCVEDGRLKRRPGVHVGPPSWNDIKDKPESFGASSWNDLEDKPFYERLEHLVSMTITEYYESYDGIRYQAKTPIELDVVKGESYVVNVDGILYPCKGVHRNYMTSSHFYIGNGGLNIKDFPGNGEPFVICHCWDDVDGWYYSTYFSDNNPHTITVYRSIVKPLDTKYLPEALQIGEEYEYTTPIMTNIGEPWCSGLGHDYEYFKEGNMVTYVIDDKEYSGIVYYDDTDGSAATLYDENESAVAYTYNSGDTISLYEDFFNPSITHSICKKITITHGLPEKYLPNGTPCVETAHEGDIIVVKEVNDNGIPTKWESYSSVPYKQLCYRNINSNIVTLRLDTDDNGVYLNRRHITEFILTISNPTTSELNGYLKMGFGVSYSSTSESAIAPISGGSLAAGHDLIVRGEFTGAYLILTVANSGSTSMNIHRMVKCVRTELTYIDIGFTINGSFASGQKISLIGR